MFIGRDYEMNKLHSLYHEDRFHCVIMYGRRRVGKTRLLTEFCQGKEHLFYVAQEQGDRFSLEEFSSLITSHFQLGDHASSFNSWDSAFTFLGEQVSEQRLILVLDEFPYLVDSNKSLLSVLQNCIDHSLLESKLFLVLCGSSVSFMENEVLAHKSPLFGRRTAQMIISPLDFFDAQRFLPGYTSFDRLTAYGVLGGTPQYLLQFDTSKSFDENICERFYEKSSYLYMEAELLLRQELNNPARYISILESIAGGASRLNEISTKIGETTSKTTGYIKTLLELRILKKEIPMLEKANTKKTIYRLYDNFFAFYYRYVRRYISLIEQELGAQIYLHRIKDSLSDYLGFVFEQICKEYLIRKNKRLELPFLVENIGSWWGTDPRTRVQEEIDILGISQERMLIAECKYTSKKVGMSVYHKLVERSLLVKAEDPVLYIFSKNGFEDDLSALAVNTPHLNLLTFEEMLDDIGVQ